MTVQFTHSIDSLYSYFRNVGVNGNLPDYLVCTTLGLREKPFKVIKCAQLLLSRIGLIANPYTDCSLGAVIATIGTFVTDHPELEESTTQKANFVARTLQSIQNREDPHLETLARKNHWRTHRALFEDALNRVYNYFFALGMDGKPADRYITRDLALIPKTWRSKMLLRPTTAEVVDPLQSFVATEEVTVEIKTRAEAIAKMLQIVASKKDHLNTKLGLINKLELLSQRAHYTVNKGPFFSTLHEQRQAYLRGDLEAIRIDELQHKIEEISTLDQAAKAREEISGKRDPMLWSDLPADVYRIIFKKLSAETASRIRQVCRKWNRLISDPAIWAEIAKRPESLPLFSALMPDPNANSNHAHLFRQNRKALTSLPNASFSTSRTELDTICPLAMNAWGLHPNEHFLVLLDPHHFHVRHQGRFVAIPRTAFDHLVPVEGELFTLELIRGQTGFVLKAWDLAGPQATRYTFRTPSPVNSFSIYNKMIFFKLDALFFGRLDLQTKEYSQMTGHFPLARLVGRWRIIAVGPGIINVICLDDPEQKSKVLDIPSMTKLFAATDRVCFVGSHLPVVQAVDFSTGQLLAEYQLPAAPDAVRIHKGMLLARISSSVLAFDLLTTKLIHTFESGSNPDSWTIIDGKFCTINSRRVDSDSSDRKLFLEETDITSPSTNWSVLGNGFDAVTTFVLEYKWVLDLLQCLLRIFLK